VQQCTQLTGTNPPIGLIRSSRRWTQSTVPSSARDPAFQWKAGRRRAEGRKARGSRGTRLTPANRTISTDKIRQSHPDQGQTSERPGAPKRPLVQAGFAGLVVTA
jgi:hypothetical protein